MMNFINEKVLSVKIRSQKMKDEVIEKLSEDSGNFVEELAKYIIGIVIAAVVLGGLYLLVKNVILPSLSSKIQDLFNFSA